MDIRNFLNFVLSLAIILCFFLSVPVLDRVFVIVSVALVVIRLAEWLMTTTRKFFLYKRVSPQNKAVLITGCDTGFGHLLALRLDRLGFRVFAGCLYPEGEGAAGLRRESTGELEVLPLDVTCDVSVQQARKLVQNKLGNMDLWAVVNNAGISQSGEVDWTTMEEIRKVFEVNTFGMLRVTKTFLPFLKRCKGRLVNNTSICGRFICPGYVGYCMSKSAAIALTTGLRVEMKKWGVRAISIEAFFYATPLTRPEAMLEATDSTWLRAPPEIRAEYGASYIEAFRNSCRRLLGRSSTRVGDVLDCFEDAVAAQEPLARYFPCRIQDKIGLQMLFALPAVVAEVYQKSLLAEDATPEALMKKERKGAKPLLRNKAATK